jgi:hypothetical protein
MPGSPALAGLGLLPAPLQQRQLLVAPDERRAGRAQRLEAALGPALAQYPGGQDRRRQSLDRDRAEILVVEQPAGQPPRARSDHHRAGPGQCLQSRRKVRRLANDAAFACFSFNDQVADNDQTGGDPDPHLQRRPNRGVDPRNARPCGRSSGGGHRLDEREPGAHRALGIVLVGPRIAEIGEHAVAHVLRDKPAGAFDDRGNAAVIGADHRPQILRVEPRRQRRRADHIAEHQRQLAPLGLGPLRTLAGEGRVGAPKLGDRVEQHSPVPEQHAKPLEIAVGQQAHRIEVDAVLGENPSVLPEAEALEPSRQGVH